MTTDERLSFEDAAARIKVATLIEYDHGGGRLYFEYKDGRDLIADLYGEGHYRDYIMRVLKAAPDMLAALHSAEEALASCYQVCDYPADGRSSQDHALREVRDVIAQTEGNKT